MSHTILTEGLAALASRLSDGDHTAWDAFARRVREDDAGRRSALGRLVATLGLDRLDLELVMVLLGFQLDPEFARGVAARVGPMPPDGPTVQGLVELLCPTLAERVAARGRLTGRAPLVAHRVVILTSAAFKEHLGVRDPLLQRRIALGEPIVRFLLGEDALSESVAAVARLDGRPADLLSVVLPPVQVEQARELVVHHAAVRRALSSWQVDQVIPEGRGVTFLFSGPSGTGKTLLARALASHGGRPLLAVSAPDLPTSGVERLLEEILTEARMRDAIVLIDECEALFGHDQPRRTAGLTALDQLNDGIVILTTNHPDQLTPALARRILLHLPFEAPDAAARRQIWEVHLPPTVPLAEDVDLDVLADRYELTGGQIKNAFLVATNQAVTASARGPRLTMADLEHGCRTQLPYALEELTTRSTTHLRLRDIVLPEDAQRKVEAFVHAVRDQAFVMNTWGIGERLATGRGIAALFDGPPGTGKTFCAEIVAGEVGQPLHRVNLPQVVSKWVGETEKHIQQIFRQARASRAMLLFDEADALFASRSAEAKSATDRYANMEVNLLLQEIERFPGVCILTTNFYGALDKALTRRILFRVTFEEPDEGERLRIWETLCPARTPLAGDVDFEALARRFELTGGRIKNAFLRAVYAARRARTSVNQALLVRACEDEYQAWGRVSRDPEVVARERAERERRLREAEP